MKKYEETAIEEITKNWNASQFITELENLYERKEYVKNCLPGNTEELEWLINKINAYVFLCKKRFNLNLDEDLDIEVEVEVEYVQ